MFRLGQPGGIRARDGFRQRRDDPLCEIAPVRTRGVHGNRQDRRPHPLSGFDDLSHRNRGRLGPAHQGLAQHRLDLRTSQAGVATGIHRQETWIVPEPREGVRPTGRRRAELPEALVSPASGRVGRPVASAASSPTRLAGDGLREAATAAPPVRAARPGPARRAPRPPSRCSRPDPAGRPGPGRCRRPESLPAAALQGLGVEVHDRSCRPTRCQTSPSRRPRRASC